MGKQTVVFLVTIQKLVSRQRSLEGVKRIPGDFNAPLNLTNSMHRPIPATSTTCSARSRRWLHPSPQTRNPLHSFRATPNRQHNDPWAASACRKRMLTSRMGCGVPESGCPQGALSNSRFAYIFVATCASASRARG